MAPRIAATALAEDLATDAVNVGFDEGLLTGALATTSPNAEFAATPAITKAIAKPTASNARLALSWRSNGNAFANLLAPSDQWGRVYMLQYVALNQKYRAVFTTKDHYTANALTINPTTYSLGIPQPWKPAVVKTVAIDKSAFDKIEQVTAEDGSVTTVTTPADVALDMQRTAYVFTIVDSYGHEGVPSNPSAIIELPYDAPFRVDLTFPPQTVLANMESGYRRLYRAAFDGSESQWQFVADVPWSQLTYSDYLPLGQEAEALVSADWAEPPLMQDMVVVNGAFLASFDENRLAYSAYMLPHAWPESQRFPLPYEIVAIKATTGGLFIGTKGSPFWASGADPSAAVPVNLGANYPCLSARSVVDMGGYILYATQDGIVSVEAGGANLVSADFIDRMRWQRDFAPAGIVAFGHEGDYFFSVGNQWWVFNPTEGRGLRKVSLADVSPAQLRAVTYDAARDTTMLLRTDGKVFDIVSRQSEQPFTWKSKVHRLSPVGYSTGQVVSSVYPVTLHVESDDQTRTYQVLDERPIRLAASGRATHWALGVTAPAAARVSRLAVCQSPVELLS